MIVKQRLVATYGLSGAQVFKAFSSSKLLLALLTFFLVNITWVFFRSPDFTTAWRIFTSMFTEVKGGATLLTSLTIIKIAVIISLMFACHWFMKDRKVLSMTGTVRWWLVGGIWAAMLILLVLSQESTNSFIYFQF